MSFTGVGADQVTPSSSELSATALASNAGRREQQNHLQQMEMGSWCRLPGRPGLQPLYLTRSCHRRLMHVPVSGGLCQHQAYMCLRAWVATLDEGKKPLGASAH